MDFVRHVCFFVNTWQWINFIRFRDSQILLFFFFLSVSSHEVTKSLRDFYLGEANIRWKEYKVILVVKYHKIKKKKNVINARQ